MRLEAQLTLAARAEFPLVRLAELRPPPSAPVEVSGAVLPRAPPDPSRDAAAAPPERRSGLGDIGLSTQLRIELDQLANRFVILQFEPPDPEPVFQFPSEAQLSFSRTLNALMRAAEAGEVDVRA